MKEVMKEFKVMKEERVGSETEKVAGESEMGKCKK